MEVADYSKITDTLNGFLEEADLLVQSLTKDGDIDSVNDWGYMLRWYENIQSLSLAILMEWGISRLIFEMENPKDGFVVQKAGKDLCGLIYGYMDLLISRGRTWKMDDYRCIDFVKRVVNCLVEYKQKLEQ